MGPITATPRVKAMRLRRETWTQRLIRAASRGPLHLVLVVVALLWTFPSVGLLVSSFRPKLNVATSGWWTAFQLPFEFTLENYAFVLFRRGVGDSFVSSILITVPATFLTILVAAFMAFAFAWMRFPLRDFLFFLVIALLVVPLQMTLIPLLNLLGFFKLNATYLGIWLVHMGFGLPFAVFLLRNFFAALPREMLEASQVDGASSRVVFFRIVLPLSTPALASLGIFMFLWIWNDLLVALIFLGGSPRAGARGPAADLRGQRPAYAHDRQSRIVARCGLGAVDGGGIRLDDSSARRLLRSPALLRARASDRRAQGLARAWPPPLKSTTSDLPTSCRPRRRSSAWPPDSDLPRALSGGAIICCSSMWSAAGSSAGGNCRRAPRS